MSADWKECSVVRDRDGDLWGAPNHPALGGRWNRIGVAPLKMKAAWADELEAAYGPLIPVLDADGLPVVTTVGDLTARHVGRRVRVTAWDGKEIDDVLRELPHPYLETSSWIMYGEHVGAFLVRDLDTPCEVLP